MPITTWNQRAFQAWLLLTFAAARHQFIGYRELAQHLGLIDIAVNNVLGRIRSYCEAKGLPFLNLIVVGVNGLPNDPTLPYYEPFDLAKEQARVFTHLWIKDKNRSGAVPLVRDFEEAPPTKHVAA